MYTIRSLATPQRLDIVVTGVVNEQELLRLVSQASALAEADGSQYVCCDIKGMLEAPADTYPIAAALAAVQAPVLRVALIGPATAEGMVRALARASGAAHAVRVFRTREQASAWLSHCADAAGRSSTALRHASELDAARRREARGTRLRSVSSGSTAA